MRRRLVLWTRGRRWRVVGRASLALIGLLLLAAVVSAMAVSAAGGYGLSWWTVDGGGGASSGGAYTLHGTAGQPDAGTVSGGRYTLGGGSWPGASGEPSKPIKIWMPLVLCGV